MKFYNNNNKIVSANLHGLGMPKGGKFMFAKRMLFCRQIYKKNPDFSYNIRNSEIHADYPSYFFFNSQ